MDLHCNLELKLIEIAQTKKKTKNGRKSAGEKVKYVNFNDQRQCWFGIALPYRLT